MLIVLGFSFLNFKYRSLFGLTLLALFLFFRPIILWLEKGIYKVYYTAAGTFMRKHDSLSQIEPGPQAWEARIMPLDHSRMFNRNKSAVNIDFAKIGIEKSSLSSGCRRSHATQKSKLLNIHPAGIFTILKR